MAPRLVLLLAFVALLAALLSLTFADRGALPPEELAGACADWWCAERNTWPVGLALGFGGIAAVAAAIGAVGLIRVPDDDEPEPAARLPRDHAARRRRGH